jgi:glycosyltransferase involved in cell wall biosynthesis
MSLSYSVVIPAYNAERTLSESVESVVRQALPPLEIIVVDDGSSDSTAAVAQGFGGVRVITQANAGPGSALNAGIAAAGGDVLAFLDADDVWMPDAMEGQVEVLLNNETADAVVDDMEEFICPSESPEQAARLIAAEETATSPRPLPSLALASFAAPVLGVYTNLADLIGIDPVHEVDADAGRPVRPGEVA